MIDFILGGGTKAATTSLYQYFSHHPDVRALPEDQPHYFSHGIFGEHYVGLERQATTLAEYRHVVPKPVPGKKIGDFDRLTLHGPEAVRLVKEANPAAKMVLILRNPVDRAYSQYWMDIRECFEQRPFFDAVKAEYKELGEGSTEYCPIVRLGYYADRIKEFQKALGKDRVRVWFYEDFCEDPARVLEEMCGFLEISYVPYSSKNEIRENVTAVPKSKLSAAILRARRGWLRPFRDVYTRLPRSFRKTMKEAFLVKKIKVPPMPREARAFLSEIYTEDILALGKLTGRDLTHWLRDPDNPMALPIEVQEQQKLQQAKFFDEAVDEEFEIERPHNTGALYQWTISSKFDRAVRLLSFPIGGATLLDICCGSGMAAEFYARHGAKVSGSDISELSIGRARERARRHGFNAEFMVGDAEKLPFPDQSFDIVSVHDGLHHLPNPHAAIAEMARVARRAIIVIEPARSWLTRRAVNLRLALDYEEAGNYVYRLREDEIFEIAKKHGLTKCSYEQYLLYYRHEPFKAAKYFENTPLLSALTFSLDAVNTVVPRLGNKICVVCEREK